MSATTTPTTFSDLYTDVLNRARIALGTTAADTTNTNYAKRYVNQANQDIHIQQNWPWAERDAVLNTHALYTTGTVDIALASRTTVTGSATVAWTTAVTGMGFNTVRIGGKLRFAGGVDVHVISTIGDATSITLESRFVGTTALDDASYVYFEDEYALAADFWRPIDVRQFSTALKIPIISRREFFLRHPRNIQTGTPRICTLIERGPSTSVALRPRILFHPVPDIVYNIPYRYITSSLAVATSGTGSINLSADSDEPIVPIRYRHVLVAYALYQWYRDLKDDQRSETVKAEYEGLVARMANDVEPSRDRPKLVPPRRIYLRQTAGPFRTGRRRYETGSEFDEMKI